MKYKANGNIDKYKVRLIAKGYTQTYEINYGEKFPPIAKINVI